MIECTLDSTALVDLTRGNRALIPISTRFREAAISHVALGEVLFGAAKASNPREGDKIAKLLVGLTLLHGDEKTASSIRKFVMILSDAAKSFRKTISG
jgi:predicted nucleic acid-binding protein